MAVEIGNKVALLGFGLGSLKMDGVVREIDPASDPNYPVWVKVDWADGKEGDEWQLEGQDFEVIAE